MIRALYSLLVTVFAISFVIGAASQAGFEWVPAQKSSETATPETPAPQKPQQRIRMIPAPSAESSATTPMIPMPGAQSAEPEAPTDLEATDISEPMAPPPAPKVKTTIHTNSDTGAKITPDVKAEILPMATEPEVITEDADAEPASTAQPKIIMPKDAPQSAMNNTPASKRMEIQAFPEVTEAPQPTPQPAMEMPAETPAQEQVMGFGSDVPLAIALGQVVPPSFALSFGDNVNPGAKVSWNGGKGWEEIVTEMVAPLGLNAVIRSNVVHIKEDGKQTSMQMDLPKTMPEDADNSAQTVALLEMEPMSMSEPPTPISEPLSAQLREENLKAEISQSEDASSEIVIEPLSITSEDYDSPTKKPLPAAADETVTSLDITEPPVLPLPGEKTKRTNITDPGLAPIEQKTETVSRIEEITANSSGKTAEELNTRVLESNNRKPVIINAQPLVAEMKTEDLAPPATTTTASATPTPAVPQKLTELPKRNNVVPTPSADFKPTIKKAPTGEAPLSASKVRFWEAKEGSSLKETLMAWSAKVDTELVWNSSHDYVIKSNLLVNDTFQNAVRTMFSKVLENPNGPSLQLISESGSDEPSKLVIDDLG